MSDAIQEGAVWARVSHGTVVDVQGDSVRVKNEKGVEWSVSKSIVEAEFNFAGSFSVEKRVSLTELENIFKTAVGSNVFEVVFTKKPDPAVGVAEIDKAQWEKATKKRKVDIVKGFLRGQERTLTGRLDHDAYAKDGTDDTLGRMKVVDLKVEGSKNNRRLVDLRTVKQLTVGNVKYIVK